MQKIKVESLKQVMKRMRVNIIGLSEIRWKRAGCITSEGYRILYSGAEHHCSGVGGILDLEISKAIKRFWTARDRAILCKLQSNHWTLALYKYMQTKMKKEVEIFYETVKKAMKQLKSQDIKIVLGDYN